MPRKRLIFFVTADPAADPSPIAAAYHFASAAAAAHLDAEVRLAGDAVLVADPAYVASVDAPRRCANGSMPPPTAISTSPCVPDRSTHAASAMTS